MGKVKDAQIRRTVNKKTRPPFKVLTCEDFLLASPAPKDATATIASVRGTEVAGQEKSGHALADVSAAAAAAATVVAAADVPVAATVLSQPAVLSAHSATFTAPVVPTLKVSFRSSPQIQIRGSPKIRDSPNDHKENIESPVGKLFGADAVQERRFGNLRAGRNSTGTGTGLGLSPRLQVRSAAMVVAEDGAAVATPERLHSKRPANADEDAVTVEVVRSSADAPAGLASAGASLSAKKEQRRAKRRKESLREAKEGVTLAELAGTELSPRFREDRFRDHFRIGLKMRPLSRQLGHYTDRATQGLKVLARELDAMVDPQRASFQAASSTASEQPSHVDSRGPRAVAVASAGTCTEASAETVAVATMTVEPDAALTPAAVIALHAEIARARDQLTEEVERAERGAMLRLQRLEEDLQRAQVESDATALLVTTLRDALVRCTAALDCAGSEAAAERAKVEFLQGEIARAQERRDAAEARSIEAEAASATLAAELTALAREDFVRFDAEIARLRELVARAMSHAEVARDANAALSADSASAQNRAAQLAEECALLRAQAAEAEAAQWEYNKGIEKDLMGLQSANIDLTRQIAALARVNSQLGDELDETRRELFYSQTVAIKMDRKLTGGAKKGTNIKAAELYEYVITTKVPRSEWSNVIQQAVEGNLAK